MVSLPSPDGLPAHAAVRYDVFLSFTRAAPDAAEQTEGLARVVEAKGLTVFRDDRIDELDGITAGLANALAASTVLLAHYSRQLPTRYACQCELTAAFLGPSWFVDPLE